MRRRLYRCMFSVKYLWALLALMLFVMSGFYLEYVMYTARFSSGYFTYTKLAASESFLLSSDGAGMVAYCVVVPLIASFVASSLFNEDEAAGMREAIFTREGRWIYHFRNMVAIVFSSFLLAVIPLALNLLCVMAAFPLSNACMRNIFNFEPTYGILFNVDNPFEVLVQYHPYMAIWLGIMMNGLVSAVVSLMSYGLSILVRICYAKMRYYYCPAIGFFAYLAWNLFLQPAYSSNPQVVFTFWPYMTLTLSWNSLLGFMLSFLLFLLASIAMVVIGERMHE